MDMTYEHTDPYNDFMIRQDQQDMIDAWCEDAGDDYKDDFAPEWIKNYPEVECLLTLSRDQAISHLATMREDFEIGYQDHLQKLAREELFGDWE